eukprot:15458610-Alexandrium_andersonii.AAC.1
MPAIEHARKCIANANSSPMQCPPWCEQYPILRGMLFRTLRETERPEQRTEQHTPDQRSVLNSR